VNLKAFHLLSVWPFSNAKCFPSGFNWSQPIKAVYLMRGGLYTITHRGASCRHFSKQPRWLPPISDESESRIGWLCHATPCILTFLWQKRQHSFSDILPLLAQECLNAVCWNCSTAQVTSHDSLLCLVCRFRPIAAQRHFGLRPLVTLLGKPIWTKEDQTHSHLRNGQLCEARGE